MNNTYAKAYTEVFEIISHFSNDELSKLPIEKIEFYKNNMDKNYSFKINPEIDLDRQNISREAKAIIITLFRDYYATDVQKQKLDIILKQNDKEKEAERIKREKYNPDDIFKKSQVNNIEKAVQEENQLIEYKETFFMKFKKFILELLNF